MGYWMLSQLWNIRKAFQEYNYTKQKLFVWLQRITHLLCSRLGTGKVLLGPHPSFSFRSLSPWHQVLQWRELRLCPHLNDWLLHLCHPLWDIMQMAYPLAAWPPCSLPVIRHDYALLPAKLSSANKFTMSIIITWWDEVRKKGRQVFYIQRRTLWQQHVSWWFFFFFLFLLLRLNV